MYRRLWTTTLLCALLAPSGRVGRTQDAERRPPSPPAWTRPDVPAPLGTSEAALGLTRRLPPEYVAACTEILREMHVNPCPPLVPDGPIELRDDGGLDLMSSALNSINGRDVEANGGHWTIWVATDQKERKWLVDELHAVDSKKPSQCRFLELEGQRVEACQVAPYPDGGQYSSHISYAWQRGGVVYHVTLHGYANEPRLRMMMAALIVRETSPPPRPRFEAATIRRCADGAAAAGRERNAPQSHSQSMSSGRMTLDCQTVASLAATAYVQYENGLGHSRWAVGESGTVVTGGPSWIRSDGYTVDATAKSASSTPLMAGLMLQTLLEDRFELKVHYESRDVPVYELTKADGWYQKLQRVTAAGRCTSLDAARDDFEPPALAAGERWCSSEISLTSTVSRLNVEGATIEELSRFLSAQPFIGRRVSDRTGFPGRFDFHLEFAPRPDHEPIAPADGRSIFTALREQLGLKLEPASGPGRFLVVDRVERPREH
jgi:uncharacterized protein (TIGR03435 family)